jgi:hypothetical protein
MNVKTTTIKVTPEIAAEWLEKYNTKNRNMRPLHVAKIAQDIVDGRWFLNGATIVIGTDNTLLDGQHRLAAIVKSKTPVDMIVVTGVLSNSKPTIDGNIPRKANDILSLDGYANSRALVAVARMLMCIKDGNLSGRSNHSNIEINDFVTLRPDIAKSVSITKDMKGICPPSIIGTWHYLAFNLSQHAMASEAALSVLKSGIPAYDGDPIHLFRERMIKMSTAEKHLDSQRMALFYTLVGAWNDFILHKKTKICKIRQTIVDMANVSYPDI